MSNLHPTGGETETTNTDRGLFGFGKKTETPVATPTEPPHKPTLTEKLHRSGSSSSSSSDEEVIENGAKIRKPRRKGIAGKIKDKLPGGHKDEYETATPIAAGEYYHQEPNKHASDRGVAEKIKEKLPGGHKDEYGTAPTGDHCHQEQNKHASEMGAAEKIKDKLPGGQKDEYGTAPTGDHYHRDQNKHTAAGNTHYPEGNKGFVGNVKDKLPGNQTDVNHHQQQQQHPAVHVSQQAVQEPHHEKKGLLDNIKDKMPGGHKDDADKAHKGY
uniref:Dehydrin n=1 Tax=Cerastium arcticum TaxID=271554 RepID=E1B219_9CARY|nr:dehydrin [Cerastium arcticum]